jgi:hypothetical protein
MTLHLSFYKYNSYRSKFNRIYNRCLCVYVECVDYGVILIYSYREDKSETLLPIAFCMRSLMGTELMRICVKEDNDDFPSVPPGFESYTSFALKRVEENEKHSDKNLTSTSTSASESQSTQVGNAGVQISDTAKVSRSLRRRPWINHGQCENGSEEDCDCERHDQVSLMWIHL